MSQKAMGYTIRDSALGRLLIAASHRGVCHVRFAEPDRAASGGDLEDDLRAGLPSVGFERADVGMKQWGDVVLSCIDGHRAAGRAGSPCGLDSAFDVAHAGQDLAIGVEPALRSAVPLDVAGTRFQRRVWAALLQIPRGETRCYSDIASNVGLPKGARAVARACTANPVAVLIPCHRVISRSGEIGGYRWGGERKRALLAQEQGAIGFS